MFIEADCASIVGCRIKTMETGHGFELLALLVSLI